MDNNNIRYNVQYSAMRLFLLCCVVFVLIISCTSNGIYSNVKSGNLIAIDNAYVTGTNLNYPDEDENSALLIAVEHENETTVLFLLERGADPNYKRLDSISPFGLAVEKGNLNLIHTFIQFNADINEKNINGWTPLMTAAESGNMKVVKFFVRNRAYVLEKTNTGIDALWLAKKSGNRELVAYLEKVVRKEEKKLDLQLRRSLLIKKYNQQE